jgi:hypothetical protein
MKYYIVICLEGLGEMTKKLRTLGILTNIRTRNLLNTSLERCRHISLLDENIRQHSDGHLDLAELTVYKEFIQQFL